MKFIWQSRSGEKIKFTERYNLDKWYEIRGQKEIELNGYMLEVVKFARIDFITKKGYAKL